MHHAARTGRADRIAVSVEFIQRVKRIDLFKQRDAVFVAKAIVIDVFDDAQPLGNVDDILCHRRAAFAQAFGRKVNHRGNVSLARFDNIGRQKRRVRRSVIGHLAKDAAPFDRKLDDQRN